MTGVPQRRAPVAPSYDFFATPVGAPAAGARVAVGAPSAPRSSVPPPGAPAAFRAGVNQFGTPVGMGAAPAWTPAASSQFSPPSRGSGGPRVTGVALPGWLVRVGVGLGIAVVLGLFGVGRFSDLNGWLAGDLEPPQTLGGMALSPDQESIAAAGGYLSGLAGDDLGDADVAFAAYGDLNAGQGALLVGMRGDVLEDAPSDPTALAALTGMPGARPSGPGVCADQEGLRMCLVVRDGVLANVVQPAVTTTDESVLALALEAQRALD